MTPAVIHALHEELLGRFGGLSGVRDEGLLDSALGRPQNLFAYGEPSIFEMAAEYAVGIVENHRFLDGNKRTGFMATYIFLGVNGQDFSASEEQVVIQTIGLAAGEVSGDEYATWLEASCKLAE